MFIQFSLEYALGFFLAFISKLVVEKFLYISLSGWKGVLFTFIVAAIFIPLLIDIEDRRRYRGFTR